MTTDLLKNETNSNIAALYAQDETEADRAVKYVCAYWKHNHNHLEAMKECKDLFPGTKDKYGDELERIGKKYFRENKFPCIVSAEIINSPLASSYAVETAMKMVKGEAIGSADPSYNVIYQVTQRILEETGVWKKERMNINLNQITQGELNERVPIEILEESIKDRVFAKKSELLAESDDETKD